MKPSLTFLALFFTAAFAHSATVTVTATAYCPCARCCGPMGGTGTTASGKQARQGITVAASRSIPFGSKIVVNGRTFLVQDRLAARFDSRVDFFFDSHTDALAFGKRVLSVTILAAPSPAILPARHQQRASSPATGAAISSKSTRRKS